MNVNILNTSGLEIAEVNSDIVIINDVQSAIDFIATIRYTTPCDSIIINKEALGEVFF